MNRCYSNWSYVIKCWNAIVFILFKEQHPGLEVQLIWISFIGDID